VTIAAGELEEFRRILQAHGLAAADFDLAKEERPPRAMFFREEGMIRVSHRPTGTVRTYADVPGSNWVADFKRDLEQHVFDS
jgi:hypothetical protein